MNTPRNDRPHRRSLRGPQSSPRAGLHRRPLLASALAACLLGPGCDADDDEDGKDDGNPPNSAWLVGQDGAMFRLGTDGALETYALTSDADFNAIICKGEATAWVVGDQGTVLFTRDGGEHWDPVTTIHDAIPHLPAASIDFAAVAAAEADPEGVETVLVVGSDGAALRSDDGGQHWRALAGADGIDFTSVALDETGQLAVLTAADGSIWRTLDGQTLQHVRSQPGTALHAVAASHSGRELVAVGQAGTMLTSADAGQSWTATDSLTTRDLYAVRMAGHGRQIVAVGQAGAVVRIDGSGVSVEELLDPALALHGLHLRGNGPGQAVGDAGVVLVTEDLGASWTPLAVDTTVPLRGVDDFHVGAHL